MNAPTIKEQLAYHERDLDIVRAELADAVKREDRGLIAKAEASIRYLEGEIERLRVLLAMENAPTVEIEQEDE